MPEIEREQPDRARNDDAEHRRWLRVATVVTAVATAAAAVGQAVATWLNVLPPFFH